MENPKPPIQKKFKFTPCSVFLLLVSVICIASIVLIVIIAPSAYNTLSYFYYIAQADQNYGQANFTMAISEYSMAIDRKPDNPYAYAYRGSAYAHQEDYTNAKRDLEKAISLDPSFATAYNQLCWYGSLLGDAANVLSACERAVALEPNNPHFRDSRGLARALTGDYQGAILDFQFFVDMAGTSSYITSADVRERIIWISSLRQATSPFDGPELDKLLHNDHLQEAVPQFQG